MGAALRGSCPDCGKPARGAGGTRCWKCYKRRARGTSPDYERLSAEERHGKAANTYADAERDEDFERAKKELHDAGLAVAAAEGWRPPRHGAHTVGASRSRRPSARRSVRRPFSAPAPLPLFTWAAVPFQPVHRQGAK